MNKMLYEKEVDAQLRDWNARFALVKARAGNAGMTQQIELHQALESLERHKRILWYRLEEIRKCKETGWDCLRIGLDRTRLEAAQALARVSQRLREPN